MSSRATMSRKIPLLLDPFVRLPQEAGLVVLTSVLGASANWLALRWVYGGLKEFGDEGGDVSVVLVSFMRDFAFWKDGAQKLGLDLDAQSRAGRFAFVDGLTGLYEPPSASRSPHTVLRSGKLDDVRAGIESAAGAVRAEGRRTLLVLDGIDALLATAEGVTSLGLQDMLLRLREGVHSTVITLAADDALIHRQTTSLEKEHAALALSLAHAADQVMALRLLDTGTAKDVSGVMRITGQERHVEYLYHVAADGVKVFERGQ